MRRSALYVPRLWVPSGSRRRVRRVATVAELREYGSRLPKGLVPPIAGGAGSYYSSLILGDGPLGYWRMDDASTANGATLTDSSGYAKHGTYNVTSGSAPTGGAAGAIVNDPNPSVGWNLSGSNNWGNYVGGDFSFSGIANWAAEFWVKQTVASATSYGTCLESYAAAADWWIGIYITDGSASQGKMFMNLYAPSGTFNWQLLSNVRVDDGNWHHVVYAQQVGSGVTCYVDGVASGFAAGVGNAPASSGLLFTTIQGATNSLVGYLDEVAIYYPTTLSAAQIAMHYAVGKGRRPGQSGVQQAAIRTPTR